MIYIYWGENYADEEGMTSAISSAIIPNEKCKPGNNYLLPKAPHEPEQNYPGRMCFLH